jgi:carboxymethylenebutenolidase
MLRGFEVTIPAGEGAPATPAFAVLPEGAKRGVVVIHEIFGRRPEIDRVVERFGAAGYAAVAPDLFHRGRFACLFDVFRAIKTGRGVPVAQGRNARAWLSDKAGVEPSHVGLIGFCFGGGYALTAGAGWAAVSTNYGFIPETGALEGIGAVMGCYGTRDQSMPKSPGQLRKRLAAIHHDEPEIHLFDAGHSFLTDAPVTFGRRLIPGLHLGDYPEAREAGWERIFAFFDRKLELE